MALSKPILLIALSAALISSISSLLFTRHGLLTIIISAITLFVFASASHHPSLPTKSTHPSLTNSLFLRHATSSSSPTATVKDAPLPNLPSISNNNNNKMTHPNHHPWTTPSSSSAPAATPKKCS
jgi:hypothetical protein